MFNVGVTTEAGAKTSSVPSQLHAESLHVIVPTFHIPPPYFPHCSCAFPNPFTEIAQQTPLTISEDQIQHVIPGLQVFVFFLALDSTDKPSPSLPRHHCLWTLPSSTPPSQSLASCPLRSPFQRTSTLVDTISLGFPSAAVPSATATALGFLHLSLPQITCKSHRLLKGKLDPNHPRICSFPYSHLSWGAEPLPTHSAQAEV